MQKKTGEMFGVNIIFLTKEKCIKNEEEITFQGVELICFILCIYLL